MLTRKQYQLLQFVHRHLKEEGVSPSFDEMKDALGLRSKSGIHRLITALEERGFIRRLPHRARAIEILRLPDEAAGQESGTTPAGIFHQGQGAVQSNVISGGWNSGLRTPGGQPRTREPQEADQLVSLPLYGRIAAGTPIEALRDETTFLQVPRSLLGRGEHYALEVEGDSMVEAGILDGDTVLIQRAEAAESGTIVVALVDGEEVTLKRLRRRKGAVALEPANKAYETRLFPPDRVQIQGRLVGLLRRY